jgi:hypothetical protein
MSISRPLAEIRAEIAKAHNRLQTLSRERAAVQAERRTGIVADFDAGLDHRAIAARWGVSYGYVAALLHRARRTTSGRRRDRLTPCQRTHYDKLLECGVRSRLAASIARAVAP